MRAIRKTLKNERLNKVNTSRQGYGIKIVEYNTSADIIVEIQDESKALIHSKYSHFINGSIDNPYHRSICNVGYFGIGIHVSKVKGKNTKKYNAWANMIRRAYSEEYHKNKPTYVDCTVCQEWHNFQVFGDWYNENYYEIDEMIMELDKDILSKGNKTYQPENCVFVPPSFNSLLTKSDKVRGKYPIGTSFTKRRGTYMAQCQNQLIDLNKHTHVYLGDYSSSEEAFMIYKTYKEAHIKEVAEYYKGKIPIKLYEAMYRYVVCITD